MHRYFIYLFHEHVFKIPLLIVFNFFLFSVYVLLHTSRFESNGENLKTNRFFLLLLFGQIFLTKHIEKNKKKIATEGKFTTFFPCVIQNCLFILIYI